MYSVSVIMTVSGEGNERNPETEIKRAVGILMSFDINSGKHSIIMKYTPPGRIAGIVISLLVLTILLFAEIKNKIS